MNASATIRKNYVQASYPRRQRPAHSPPVAYNPSQESRPADQEKLESFSAVDHIQLREAFDKERSALPPPSDDQFSYMEFDEPEETFTSRVRKMFTIFPYRDPIYIVTIIFTLGSLDLVINALFDLLPRVAPETNFPTAETVAVPTTVLIGSIFFFVAGIFDTFAALNADRGTLETVKAPSADGETMGTRIEYKPALLGTPEWTWRPSWVKFTDLATTNLAFQAGLVVLFGGIIFMIAGITDFPGVVPSESSSLTGLFVFGPQVVHGFLFFIANALLAFSLQDKWWKPKLSDSDWQGSMLNAIGGFGFMMAGFFLYGTLGERKMEAIEKAMEVGMEMGKGKELGEVGMAMEMGVKVAMEMMEGESMGKMVGEAMGGALAAEIKSASAALIGSSAFLMGSLLRWGVVMEIY